MTTHKFFLDENGSIVCHHCATQTDPTDRSPFLAECFTLVIHQRNRLVCQYCGKPIRSMPEDHRFSLDLTWLEPEPEPEPEAESFSREFLRHADLGDWDLDQSSSLEPEPEPEPPIHMRKVRLTMDRFGYLEVADPEAELGQTAYIQSDWDISAVIDNCMLTRAQLHDLRNGWTIDCFMYDELHDILTRGLEFA